MTATAYAQGVFSRLHDLCERLKSKTYRATPVKRVWIPMDSDVLIIGAGIAGLTTAARLQASGLSTIVLEAHGQVGGCAGFFCRGGFSFDVGATTFVDFAPGGVGGQFLAEIGLAEIPGEVLSGYQAWLPDRTARLFRDSTAWRHERLAVFGQTPAHRQFWNLLDQLADVFWTAARDGIKLPFRSVGDIWQAARLLPAQHWRLGRYGTWTMADALRACNLADDIPLRGFLGMLIQDTTHSTIEGSPLINSALGITIRGAGLTRPSGGARGFWRHLVTHYRAIGGRLKTGAAVERVSRIQGGFAVHTRRSGFQTRQVVSTLPIWNTARLGLPEIQSALRPYLQRDATALGGAIVVFLGVPEAEVDGQIFSHHQLLLDYHKPLANGNNMFVSVSAPGDTESAPPDHCAVMLSTHCDLAEWENLSAPAYAAQKSAITRQLIDNARQIYPNLGARNLVLETGTPRTFSRYTRRYRGAVGGMRLSLRNSNQFAVPYDLGVPGFWQAGDTTWPGLGTVACVLGSRHVAEGVRQLHERLPNI